MRMVALDREFFQLLALWFGGLGIAIFIAWWIFVRPYVRGKKERRVMTYREDLFFNLIAPCATIALNLILSVLFRLGNDPKTRTKAVVAMQYVVAPMIWTIGVAGIFSHHIYEKPGKTSRDQETDKAGGLEMGSEKLLNEKAEHEALDSSLQGQVDGSA